MDTRYQLGVFISCVAIGFLGGVLYELFAFFALPFQKSVKGKKLVVLFDIAFWLSFSVFSVWVSCLLKFPDFRAFWWIGYLFGGIIYLKTLHKIIAFLENVCYNKVAHWIKKTKKREKTLKKRRVKSI